MRVRMECKWPTLVFPLICCDIPPVLMTARDRFRWVSLQIQSLCDGRRIRSEKDILRELGRLPRSLAELYARAFDQISGLGSASRGLAVKALSFLLAAFRPVSWREFLYLMAASDHGVDRTPDRDEILDVTCNFLDDGLSTEYVAFCHLSAREYLERRSEFQSCAIHLQGASVCLGALLNPRPLELILKERSVFAKMTFLTDYTYPSLYLGDHLAETSASARRPLLSSLERFLFHDTTAFHEWRRMLDQIGRFASAGGLETRLHGHLSFICTNPVEVSCAYGLEEILVMASKRGDIQRLLYRRWKTSQHHGILGFLPYDRRAIFATSADPLSMLHGKDPLETAVILRRESIIQQCQALGLSIDRYSSGGKTLLHVACENGYKSMVDLLLSFGADANKPIIQSSGLEEEKQAPRERMRHYETYRHNYPADPVPRPLSSMGFRVAGHGPQGIMSPFREEFEVLRPIHLAVAAGKSAGCARRLARRGGADVNARTSRGATALQMSLEVGDASREIVELLLEMGADPNADVGFGRTMVHVAAAMGLRGIVSRLLSYGGDPARRDEHGQTPSDAAARFHHKGMVALLDGMALVRVDGDGLASRGGRGRPSSEPAGSSRLQIADELVARDEATERNGFGMPDGGQHEQRAGGESGMLPLITLEGSPLLSSD